MPNDFNGTQPYFTPPQSLPRPLQSGGIPAVPARQQKISSNGGGILAGLKSGVDALSAELKQFYDSPNQTMPSYAPAGKQTNPGYRQSPVIYQSPPYATYQPQYQAPYPLQYQSAQQPPSYATYQPQHQTPYPLQYQSAQQPPSYATYQPQPQSAQQPPSYAAYKPQTTYQPKTTHKPQSEFSGPGGLLHPMTVPSISTRPTERPAIPAHEKLPSNPIFSSSTHPTYTQHVSTAHPEKSVSGKAAATPSTNEVTASPMQSPASKIISEEKRLERRIKVQLLRLNDPENYNDAQTKLEKIGKNLTPEQKKSFEPLMKSYKDHVEMIEKLKQERHIKVQFYKLNKFEVPAEAYDAKIKLDNMGEKLTPKQQESLKSLADTHKNNAENRLNQLKSKEYKPEEFSTFKEAYINLIKNPWISKEQQEEADNLAGNFSSNEFKLEDIIGNVPKEDDKLKLIKEFITEITEKPEKYGELSNMILDTCSGARDNLEAKARARAKNAAKAIQK